MGWGVNDNETFSYQLEKKSKNEGLQYGSFQLWNCKRD